MAAKRHVVRLLTGMFCVLMASAAIADAATTGVAADKGPQPRRLKVYAFVTVKPVAGAAKATIEYVTRMATKGIPEELFEEVTVLADCPVTDARRKALGAKGDVFLHVKVDPPQQLTQTIKHTYRLPRGVGGGRWGGRGGRGGGGAGRGTVTVDRSIRILRSHVQVEMSIRNAGSWRRVKQIKLSSADAPPAEAGDIANDTDITEKWGKGVKVTTRAAVERAVNEYFFRNVTLRAIEGEPTAPAGDDEAPPKPTVRIELVNRGHCRITDATVTVEKFDTNRKRWEPMTGAAAGGGGRGGRASASSPVWAFPADVDPGEKALSEAVELSVQMFKAMTRERCRFVLHATPGVFKLVQPLTPHKLKPTPKVEP